MLDIAVRIWYNKGYVVLQQYGNSKYEEHRRF